MKTNWRTKKLEDCLGKVVYTSKVQKKDFLKSGSFPIISQEFEFINGYWNNEKDLFKIEKPIVIFGDHTQILKYVDFDFVLGADGVKILSPKDFLNSKFFYYFLQSVDLKNLGYARHYRLLKEIQIPLLPLPEQRRIVKTLNEVFKKVAKARESAEKNLQNAKEVFESYLQSVFTNLGKDWEEKRLGEVLKLEYGKPLPKSYRKNDGLYPVYGANGIKDFSDKFYFSKPSIVVGRKGSAGELHLVEKNFWPLDVSYYVTFDNKKYNINFLYHLLINLELPKLAKGVKPGINRNEVYSIDVNIPPFPEQKSIVKKLDALSAETKKLEGIYRQKLADLEELKKSVLKKAFAGEL